MPAAGKTIALVIGSTRTPRMGPHIQGYIQKTYLEPLVASLHPDIRLETVDLQAHQLPIFDEPMHPAGRPKADPTPAYAHEHTRRWSALVRGYDAFVFFTPEYNGSIPAGLKTAVDALFHEWTGKPAGVVAYSGGGGASVAAHLRAVLGVVGLKVVPTTVNVPAGGKTLASFNEEGKPRDEDLQRWAEVSLEEKSKSLLSEIIAQLNETEGQ